MAVIDLKDKKKPFYAVDIRYNVQGDAFLVADTRGQVTMFQVQANRYIVVCQSTKPGNVLHACFTSRHPVDQVLVALKDKSIQTHSMNGKLIDKFTGVHASEIKCLAHNQVNMGTIVTQSADSCILWQTTGGNVVK